MLLAAKPYRTRALIKHVYKTPIQNKTICLYLSYIIEMLEW